MSFERPKINEPNKEAKLPIGRPVENNMDRLPSIEVKNHVIWVNPHFSNMPLNLKKGEPSALGLFLVSPPKEAEYKDTEFTQKPISVLVKFGHTRSAMLGSVIFEDNQGHKYRDIDLKGLGLISFTNGKPKVEDVNCKVVGDIYVKGQRIDDTTMQQTLKQDHVMGIRNRGHAIKDCKITEQMSEFGIRTHRILAVIDLNEIIISSDQGHEIISISEAKKRRYIPQNCQPVIEVRAFGTKARVLEDRVGLENRDASLRKGIEDDIKDARKMVAQELDIKPENFGRSQYFEWLAYTHGRNIGLLHANGYSHGYTNGTNLTLDGRLIDTDGVSRSFIKCFSDIDDASDALSEFAGSEAMNDFYKGYKEALVIEEKIDAESQKKGRMQSKLEEKEVIARNIEQLNGNYEEFINQKEKELEEQRVKQEADVSGENGVQPKEEMLSRGEDNVRIIPEQEKDTSLLAEVRKKWTIFSMKLSGVENPEKLLELFQYIEKEIPMAEQGLDIKDRKVQERLIGFYSCPNEPVQFLKALKEVCPFIEHKTLLRDDLLSIMSVPQATERLRLLKGVNGNGNLKEINEIIYEDVFWNKLDLNTSDKINFLLAAFENEASLSVNTLKKLVNIIGNENNETLLRLLGENFAGKKVENPIDVTIRCIGDINREALAEEFLAAHALNVDLGSMGLIFGKKTMREHLFEVFHHTGDVASFYPDVKRRINVTERENKAQELYGDKNFRKFANNFRLLTGQEKLNYSDLSLIERCYKIPNFGAYFEALRELGIINEDEQGQFDISKIERTIGGIMAKDKEAEIIFNPDYFKLIKKIKRENTAQFLNFFMRFCKIGNETDIINFVEKSKQSPDVFLEPHAFYFLNKHPDKMQDKMQILLTLLKKWGSRSSNI